MAEDNTSNRGSGNMEGNKQRGGSKENGGQFKKGSQRASEAGKRGAAAQSREDKARGGENSQRSSSE